MAKECYLEIDGKRTKLTDEQLKALGLYEEPKKSPFNRVEKEKSYYLINSCGEVESVKDCYWNSDKTRHDIANYCTDKEILQQRAMHEKLNRLLWRFSMENDGDKINWKDFEKEKWFIFLNKETSELKISNYMCMNIHGVIFFYTKTIAERALDEIIKPFIKEHPYFVW